MRPPTLAVYPGSFDPITLGHLNVVQRASRLFDRLVVAVGINTEKAPWFSPEERCEFIRSVAAELGLNNVETTAYEGLTVRFAKSIGARVIVRGVRPLTDIPAELTMMMANRRLEPDVETLFLIADGELAHVSSSLVKEIAGAKEDGDGSLEAFLPASVIEAVRNKVAERNNGKQRPTTD
ncbi:MAG: pantetheine-phosphate adenylyltransferase [Thermoguttaceae bacterium]|jgi:pantetheine-phosphate adenylyltransferase|nr:pantetheine-phosphate adenylyltransferase [Thermoguttaceae bacterium]